MLAVVVSRADRASEHIGEQLLALDQWTERTDADRSDAEGGGTYYTTDGIELRTFEELHLHLDDTAAAFSDPDLLFFASRHSGDTGALLTAHATGNFGPAEFGGTDGDLARAAPNALADLLVAFDRHAPDEYGVGMECTHHGPSEVGCPSLFVELGSSDEQWDDSAGAEAVARAVLDVRDAAPDRERQLVGFGGGHYVPRFERVVRETDWAVGHVAADWGLDDMGHPREATETVEQAFEQSAAEVALVDGDHPVLREVVADLGYRVVSETWVRETSAVPLDTVERAEAALCPVDDGLRFGAPAAGHDGEFAVVELPAELTEEATNVDPDAARAAVADRAVAFETVENGTRPRGRAALAAASRDDLVCALADVLREGYDEVTVAEDRVVAREEAFDPAKAKTLGIEEGPAFGKLAAGESVEVRGREIDPERVRTAREVEFPR
ncbi:D-aminoacyl-tRNA deacylase [Halorarius halobius]|uniref:D-aminoacyl-tRNA deacylase n=1 Tax=Halorarius halobius TaxID=2962671 RepID=UPI0020CD118D|nr:D-aminoacyl-tRNA deacylase [Halorarius halobius]